MFSTTGYLQEEGPIYELRLNMRNVAKNVSQEIYSYMKDIFETDKLNRDKVFLTTSIEKLKKIFNI